MRYCILVSYHSLSIAICRRSTSQAYIVKLLATYEGEEDVSEVKQFAAEGVVGAIKSAVTSFTKTESLIEFAAVKQVVIFSTLECTLLETEMRL